jgi:hypothetical protein
MANSCDEQLFFSKIDDVLLLHKFDKMVYSSFWP